MVEISPTPAISTQGEREDISQPCQNPQDAEVETQIQTHLGPRDGMQSQHTPSLEPTTSHPSEAKDRAKPGRKRGHARSYTDWGTNDKLYVKLNNQFQPIGKTAPLLPSQLGIIARNGPFTPLTYTDWRCKELDSYKERILNDVKSVGKKWKAWKEYLKSEVYDKFNTDEERLANCIDRVDTTQWKALVAFWGSEMFKERSEKNKENQLKKTGSYRWEKI